MIRGVSIIQMAQTSDLREVMGSVATYGDELSTAVRQHAEQAQQAVTCAPPLPVGFGRDINNIHVVSKMLRELLVLVQSHADHGDNLFSQGGLEYTHLLAVKCGVTLIRIKAVLTKACLSDDEAWALKSQQITGKAVVRVVDLAKLRLGKKFLKGRPERWMRAWRDHNIRSCLSRLHDLTVHLVLIFRVIILSDLAEHE